MKYWINTVSYDHVKKGMDNGFTQANHGKNTGLKRLSKGDYIIYYSPRTHLKNGEPLQQFTAIARVNDDELYQVEMTPAFHPWRRRVESIPVEKTSIHPLIEHLSFIKNKQNWGYIFRRGLFEIPKEDFNFIAGVMKAKIEI